MLRTSIFRKQLVTGGKRFFSEQTSPPLQSALWGLSDTYKIEGKESVTLGRGKVAGLADGAVIGRDRNSVVLATVVSDSAIPDDITGDDGTPFSVEYSEKAAASGRIPKTPNRREAPNNESEILTGRAVDRCLRPLFPPLYSADTQLSASVQAFDSSQPEPPISLVANASSAALHTSDIPWNGPIGCVRVARVKGRLICEPTKEELASSELDLIYAGTAERTVMIEMSAHQLPNDQVKKALRFAHSQVEPIISAQKRLRDLDVIAKRPESSFELTTNGASKQPDFSAHQRSETWNPLSGLFSKDNTQPKKTESLGSDNLLKDGANLAEKLDGGEARGIFSDHSATRADRAYREAMFTKRLTDEISAFCPEWPSGVVGHVVHQRLWLGMRHAVLDSYADNNGENCRCDGRSAQELREISTDMTVLPSVHGSSLFSRGNTQVMCTATLGAAIDAIDTSARSALGGPVVHGKTSEHLTTLDPSKAAENSDLRRLMLHYDFPAFCTGEIKQGGGPNRRAMGHGALAQKSLDAVMPPPWRFPYVVRLACEVLSSNGSSSMASVCAGTMALLDAGVPLLAPVAGVSVGLISREKEGGELEHALLADILGLEDHYGDMDFKVAGSRKGVTAIQLDVKLEGGVPLDILEDALEVALTARCSILDNMEAELVKNIPDSKGNNFAGGFDAFMQRGLTIKSHAPRLRVVTFARDRLQFLLGPGGETKRMIEREHDCMLDLGDDAHEVGPSGTSTGCVVHVFAPDKASCEAATRMVQELVCDVEDGAILSAVVQEVKDYGAFVEVLRGRTGLLHVSEISNVVSGMGAVELLKAGDCLDVMCIGSDPLSGAVKLSRKRILDKNDRPKESAFSKTGSQSGSRPDTRPPRRSSTSDTSR